MAGLVPGIHVFSAVAEGKKDMDTRDKPGHDDFNVADRVPKQKAAATLSSRCSRIVKSLLLVADAIDRAGPVVGDEDRTVLVQDDVGRVAR
jgi:hypothetical protein